MEIDITKITSKGQVVIPQEIRIKQNLKKGDKMLVISSANKIILEPIKSINKKTIEEIEEDIIDKKIADEYWEKEKQGKLITKSKKEFLSEIEEW